MMNIKNINSDGILLLGCGKMGSALLQGWLDNGLKPQVVSIIDPYPSDWVKSLIEKGVRVNKSLPDAPAVCILAVKPQMMGEALAQLQTLGSSTVFMSIAAGTQLKVLEAVLGSDTPIVRAMPNTPAAIGKGITALVGNQNATTQQMLMAETLLQAVGTTVTLEHEVQMDAVTAISGSGPAYIFHIIESLAKAGESEGLSYELSLQLAKATVAGAGLMAEQSTQSPEQLRINVTSPKGTTEAALKVLMDQNNGVQPVLSRAVKAASDRSRELSLK